VDLFPFALNLVVLLVLAGGLLGWAHAVRCWTDRRPTVAWSPREPVPWGILQLAGLFLVLVVIQVAVVASGLAPAPADGQPFGEDGALQGIGGILLVYGVWLTIAWAALGLGGAASARDLGWNATEFSRDVRIGLITFAMLAPIIYWLQSVLVPYWPSRHPLVETIQESDDGRLWATAALSVVVMAPIFEEFAFRVLLQGWLENGAVILRRSRRCADEPDEESGDADLAWRVLLGTADDPERGKGSPPECGACGIASIDRPANDGASRTSWDEFEDAPWPWRIVPIAVSSGVFALLHLDHGPDWLPLLVLASALGYLYQRTHRIVPCIVVHSLLNGVSFVMLLASR